MSTRAALGSVVLAILASACSPGGRQYELRGVVVSVDTARQEITIKHEDIPRFMPGMTMPFEVRDPKVLQGLVAGDLVRGTLVVEDSDAYIRALERTGSGPVPDLSSMSRPDILEPGELAPDAAFIDQDGTARRLSDWRGQVLAVTFIYTRCPIPNFCPLMDQRFTSVQEAIQSAPELRGRVRLLSVSFDPTHDRPAVLAARAGQLKADREIWSFLTGDREEVGTFASRFGVTILQEAPAQEIVHNLRTAVIDTQGRVSAILNGNEWNPPDLTAELRKALERR